MDYSNDDQLKTRKKSSLREAQELNEEFIAQCRAEYSNAVNHKQEKKNVWLSRLKIFNNQKRNPDLVGDNLMFYTLNTMLAYFYDDKMASIWTSPNDSQESALGENLTKIAEYDYEEMGKDKLDYFWIWETLFFGRGFVEMYQFERNVKKNIFLPCPNLVGNMSLWHDPSAKSVNGIGYKRDGAARYLGYDLQMTKSEIEDMQDGVFYDLDFRMIKFSDGSDNQARYADQISQNRGGGSTYFKGQASLGSNGRYDLVKWYTYKDGKRVCAYFTAECKTLLGIVELKHDYFPIVDRPLFPDAMSWDVTSISDLTEDKQRMAAVLMNSAIQGIKAGVFPAMLYNPDRISSKHNLDISDNKAIPVTGDGDVRAAMQPANVPQVNLQAIGYILDSLKMSSERATATPEMKQGISGGAGRTASELNLVQAGADTRGGLIIKIFGWSEEEFWEMYYDMYEENFADGLDEKMLMVSSLSYSAPVYKFKKSQFISKGQRPVLKIVSVSSNRAKQLEEFKALSQTISIAMELPETDKTYAIRLLMQTSGMSRELVEKIMPKSIDERLAEAENKILATGELKKIPQVTPNDNHNVHLRIHNDAPDNEATRIHIATHLEAMVQIKNNPALAPQTPAQGASNPLAAMAGSSDTPVQTKPSQTSGGNTPTLMPAQA